MLHIYHTLTNEKVTGEFPAQMASKIKRFKQLLLSHVIVCDSQTNDKLLVTFIWRKLQF